MIIVAKMTVLPPNGDPAETIWVTSGAHYYDDSGSPVNECIPYLKKNLTFSQQLFSNNSLKGDVEIGFGKLVLVNLTRVFDEYRDYIFDGQDITIWAVDDETTPLASAIFEATRKMKYAEFGINEVEVFIESAQQKFDVEMQPSFFPETRGATDIPDWYDGGDNALGTRRPQLWGRCLNVPAIELNRFHLLYGVNYTSIGTRKAVYCFWSVYVKGGRIECEGNVANMAALIAASVSPGMYKSCLAEGVFRLGTVPVGEVTCDVSDAPDLQDGSSWNSVSSVCSRILVSAGLTAGVDFNNTELFALEAHPGGLLPCQYVVEGDETAFDAVSALLNSIGAWAIPDLDGMLRFGTVLTAAQLDAWTPDTYLTWDNWKKGSLKNLVPTTNNGIPAKTAKLIYNKHWAPSTAVLEIVEPRLRELFTAAQETTTFENSGNLHPLAHEEEISTLLVSRLPLEIPDASWYAWERYWQILLGADGTAEFQTSGVLLNGGTSAAETFLDLELPRLVDMDICFPGLTIEADCVDVTGTITFEMKFDANTVTSNISADGTDSNDLSAFTYSFNSVQFRFLAESGEEVHLMSMRWYSATYDAQLEALRDWWGEILCYPMRRMELVMPMYLSSAYLPGSKIAIKDEAFAMDPGVKFQVIAREENWGDETVKLEILRPEGA